MRKGIVMERRRGLELGRVVAHQHSHSPQPHCSQTQTGVKTVHGADTGGAAAGIGSGAVVVAERAIPQMKIQMSQIGRRRRKGIAQSSHGRWLLRLRLVHLEIERLMVLGNLTMCWET